MTSPPDDAATSAESRGRLPQLRFLPTLSLALAVAAFAATAVAATYDRPRVDWPWAPSLDLRLAFAVDGVAVLYALLATGRRRGRLRVLARVPPAPPPPDVYTQLHAASKAVFLGVISLLVGSPVTGDPAIVARAFLIGAFLVTTTPVAAHVIARGAYLRRERMETPGAVDESGRDLPRSSPGPDDAHAAGARARGHVSATRAAGRAATDRTLYL